MQRVLDRLDGFFIQPYLLFDDWHRSEDGSFRIDDRRRDTYQACMNSLFLSTSGIQTFTELKSPERIDERYLLVWGTLQAFTLQQDAVCSLEKLFVERKNRVRHAKKYKAWNTLRFLRSSAGHPTGKESRSSIATIAMRKDEWGVKIKFRGEFVDVHSLILQQLPAYEAEVLEALEPIAEGMKQSAEALAEAYRLRFGYSLG
jgi:hypothetical protein